uniref:tRNAHis guanylyltransferase catalytic domain-containing protein n=1 Tax=Brassica oleracea var. oleracea TaxID=109376 RepID=A0A0D3CH15_BRAOL
MAKSKSKKKGKLNSQPSSPHIDIGDFVDGRDDEQIRAPVWRGRDDKLNFDIYRFSLVHEFEKPNDETSLNLMNSCPAAVLEEYPNIIFAYGYSHFHSCFNVLQELDHMQVKDLKTTIYLITPTSPELDVTKPQDMVRPGSLSLLAEAYDRCIQRKHTYEMRASSSTHVSTLGSF